MVQKFVRRSVINRWLPLALVATGLVGLLYVTVQQNIRLTANQELVRTATDIQLAGDLAFQQDQTGEKTDVHNSLAPAVILLDDNKKVISSDAALNGKDISPPEGVLEYAKARGENRVTWQPRADTRLATVVLHKPGSGYILVVKNLREVESQISQLLISCVLGLGVILAGSLLATAIMEPIKRDDDQ